MIKLTDEQLKKLDLAYEQMKLNDSPALYNVAWWWKDFLCSIGYLNGFYNSNGHYEYEKLEQIPQSEDIDKFKEQQGKGKRPSKKLLAQKDNIEEWKKTGIKYREMARRLKVSEGTIRHFLKSHL